MKFLTETDNVAALAADIAEDDRLDYRDYGHNRLESAFVDRILILYESQGKSSKQILRPPKILTTIRVVGFNCDYAEGCRVKLLDESTQKTQTIGHVPQRLFSYPIFIAVPPRLTIKWDAQFMGDKLVRSLLFAILIKARNKAEFHSMRNIYLETPNRIRELYPHLDLDLSS